MRQFLMVVAFTLLTVGLFAGYSNFGIPQIEPAQPPKQEKIDLGAMTMDKFIALGEKIFNGKGTCTLCHNNLGRAPMLGGTAGLVPKRLVDPRYKGEATNVEEYLIESFVKPSAFVVAGFGKKGTNDTVSPMPDVSAGSIRLNDAEIKAVVAYLQDSGGAEVTVKIPTDAPEQTEQTEGEPRAPFETPEQAIAELGCGACHKVATEEGEVGPDLTKIGGLRDKAYLRQAILDPNADITEGFEKDQMPPDYGAQMYAQELEMMVDYLAGLK
ncbi:MAG: c-type cytochrome [Alphaproteobacteria bacterium]|nr:c-type cytochrome [Alphaproteobacteria bacterium]